MGGKAGKVHTWNKDRLKGQLEIQSMVWPGLIFLFIFSYIPMYGIIIAFKDFNIMVRLCRRGVCRTEIFPSVSYGSSAAAGF